MEVRGVSELLETAPIAAAGLIAQVSLEAIEHPGFASARRRARDFILLIRMNE
jgi:hypothetical protein